MKNSKKAFSLIEISVAILIISILIAGVASGSRLINKSKIRSAQDLTRYSPVYNIDGLVLWFEPSLDNAFLNAGNSKQVKDGDAIQAWFSLNPQVSNSISALQTTSANQPKYVKQGINNLPSLSFDGANDFFTLPSGSVPSGNSSYTVFFVLQSSPTIAIHGGILGCGYFQTSGANLHNDFYYHTSGHIRNSWRGDQAASATDSIVIGNPAIVSIEYFAAKTPNNILTYVNGALSNTYTPAAVRNSVTSPAYIGFVGQGSSFYFTGYISEIIVFNDSLEDEDRKSIEQYLSKKWKISLQ